MTDQLNKQAIGNGHRRGWGLSRLGRQRKPAISKPDTHTAVVTSPTGPRDDLYNYTYTLPAHKPWKLRWERSATAMQSWAPYECLASHQPRTAALDQLYTVEALSANIRPWTRCTAAQNGVRNRGHQTVTSEVSPGLVSRCKTLGIARLNGTAAPADAHAWGAACNVFRPGDFRNTLSSRPHRTTHNMRNGILIIETSNLGAATHQGADQLGIDHHCPPRNLSQPDLSACQILRIRITRLTVQRSMCYRVAEPSHVV